MAMNRIPGDEKLFIGGFMCMRRKAALAEANITHVLSVVNPAATETVFAPYRHLALDVYDVEDEDLLRHFATTNRFIRDGLSGGGSVLVHCAMGKSRSAACVMAYLMQKFGVSPQEALSRIQECRPMCQPNEGFMKQLALYHQMGCPPNVDDDPRYQRWLYQREVRQSVARGEAPANLHFVDEANPDGPAGESKLELRCRKCRRILATDQFLLSHSVDHGKGSGGAVQPCAHYFLEPLSWMRLELEQGKMTGRLECPKCTSNVGKYAWQGMKCNCGHWAVPGISLARSKVDEVRKRPDQAPTGQLGVSLPPTVPFASPETKPAIHGTDM